MALCSKAFLSIIVIISFLDKYAGGVRCSILISLSLFIPHEQWNMDLEANHVFLFQIFQMKPLVWNLLEMQLGSVLFNWLET